MLLKQIAILGLSLAPSVFCSNSEFWTRGRSDSGKGDKPKKEGTWSRAPSKGSSSSDGRGGIDQEWTRGASIDDSKSSSSRSNGRDKGAVPGTDTRDGSQLGSQAVPQGSETGGQGSLEHVYHGQFLDFGWQNSNPDFAANIVLQVSGNPILGHSLYLRAVVKTFERVEGRMRLSARPIAAGQTSDMYLAVPPAFGFDGSPVFARWGDVFHAASLPSNYMMFQQATQDKGLLSVDIKMFGPLSSSPIGSLDLCIHVDSRDMTTPRTVVVAQGQDASGRVTLLIVPNGGMKKSLQGWEAGWLVVVENYVAMQGYAIEAPLEVQYQVPFDAQAFQTKEDVVLNTGLSYDPSPLVTSRMSTSRRFSTVSDLTVSQDGVSDEGSSKGRESAGVLNSESNRLDRANRANRGESWEMIDGYSQFNGRIASLQEKMAAFQEKTSSLPSELADALPEKFAAMNVMSPSESNVRSPGSEQNKDMQNEGHDENREGHEDGREGSGLEMTESIIIDECSTKADGPNGIQRSLAYSRDDEELPGMSQGPPALIPAQRSRSVGPSPSEAHPQSAAYPQHGAHPLSIVHQASTPHFYYAPSVMSVAGTRFSKTLNDKNNNYQFVGRVISPATTHLSAKLDLSIYPIAPKLIVPEYVMTGRHGVQITWQDYTGCKKVARPVVYASTDQGLTRENPFSFDFKDATPDRNPVVQRLEMFVNRLTDTEAFQQTFCVLQLEARSRFTVLAVVSRSYNNKGYYNCDKWIYGFAVVVSLV